MKRTVVITVTAILMATITAGCTAASDPNIPIDTSRASSKSRIAILVKEEFTTATSGRGGGAVSSTRVPIGREVISRRADGIQFTRVPTGTEASRVSRVSNLTRVPTGVSRRADGIQFTRVPTGGEVGRVSRVSSFTRGSNQVNILRPTDTFSSFSIHDMLVSSFFEAGFEVVDRESLEAILDEQDISLADISDPRTAIRVGHLVAADYILVVSSSAQFKDSKGAWAPVSDRGVIGVQTDSVKATLRGRLTDTTKGSVAWAGTVTGTDKGASISVATIWGGGGKDNAPSLEDAFEKASNALANKAAERI